MPFGQRQSAALFLMLVAGDLLALAVSHQRITARARPDAATTHRAVNGWWRDHIADRDADHQPDWPGTWQQVPGWTEPNRQSAAPEGWPG